MSTTTSWTGLRGASGGVHRQQGSSNLMRNQNGSNGPTADEKLWVGITLCQRGSWMRNRNGRSSGRRVDEKLWVGTTLCQRESWMRNKNGSSNGRRADEKLKMRVTPCHALGIPTGKWTRYPVAADAAGGDERTPAEATRLGVQCTISLRRSGATPLYFLITGAVVMVSAIAMETVPLQQMVCLLRVVSHLEEILCCEKM
ncbi:hypothetical protein FJTKL_10987 [Diaporthe vaccinii]|uniref:Uncharacterized protein n=1 Tax=Diaporthe vaccinii TaxID=105482 RepID=A0ABR4EJC5_9PEZI